MDKYCPKCFRRYPSACSRCEADGARLISLGEEDLVGQEIDERYNVLKKLGQGGMGAVYVAEQFLIGRRVALKVLLKEVVKDESVVKRFLIEAKAIARLNNPHTITLYDFGVTMEGLLYFTMELVEGTDLSKVLKANGAIPFSRATDIVFQVCESLEEAHEKEILHRDLKPDNLMVTRRGDAEWITVLDFGIAKLRGDDTIEQVTQTGMVCGTPAYLSPEQVTGKTATPASDLYALGIILYEMLVGRPPFLDETPINVLMKHVNEAPPPVRTVRPDLDIPESMEKFLEVALRKKPEERFQTVTEFRGALQEALRGCGETERLASVSGLEATMDAVDTEGLVAPVPEAMPTVSGFEPTIAVGAPASKAASFSPASWSEVEAPSTRSRNPMTMVWISAFIAAGLVLAMAVWQPWAGVPDVPGDSTADVVSDTKPVPEVADRPPVPDLLLDTTPNIELVDRPPIPDIISDTLPDQEVITQPPDPDIVVHTPPVGEVAEQPPAPAVTAVQVIVDAIPEGVRCRWDGEPKTAGRETPYILQLTDADDGREIVCSRAGWHATRATIDLATIQEEGKLKVELQKKRKETRPEPRAEKPPEPKPPEPKPPEEPKPEEVKPEPEGDPWADI